MTGKRLSHRRVRWEGRLCLAVLLAALAASGCEIDKCKNFQAHCDGNVAVTCSGPNEFGTGSGIVRTTCTAPNPVCVLVGGGSPYCVTSTTPGCASAEVHSCRGSLNIRCVSTGATVSRHGATKTSPTAPRSAAMPALRTSAPRGLSTCAYRHLPDGIAPTRIDCG
jgi:hypothetical protein